MRLGIGSWASSVVILRTLSKVIYCRYKKADELVSSAFLLVELISLCANVKSQLEQRLMIW